MKLLITIALFELVILINQFILIKKYLAKILKKN
jgi:hypothetical protein